MMLLLVDVPPGPSSPHAVSPLYYHACQSYDELYLCYFCSCLSTTMIKICICLREMEVKLLGLDISNIQGIYMVAHPISESSLSQVSK